jgi:hypothetical protein
VQPRLVEPELLDSLSPDDPAAIHSRADLRRVNWWMRNETHLTKAIIALPSFPATILEVGAGDGTFMLGVARNLARHQLRPVHLYLLDMEPVVRPETLAGFNELGWEVTVIRQNLHDWLVAPIRVDLIIANLFLHHFLEEQLRRFFQSFSESARAVVASEPRRWGAGLIGCRLLGLIGCNYVTRHDALVSVRAGFRGRELSEIWPQGKGFLLSEFPAGFATHLFTAVRTSE